MSTATLLPFYGFDVKMEHLCLYYKQAVGLWQTGEGSAFQSFLPFSDILSG